MNGSGATDLGSCGSKAEEQQPRQTEISGEEGKKRRKKSKHGGQKEVGNGSGERKVEGGRLDWGSKEKE